MSAGRGQHARGGFTLIEVCLAGTLTSLVLASAMGLFMAYQWAYRELGLEVEAQRRASGALARMVYGTGTLGVGLRSAGDVVVAATGDGWQLRVEDAEGNAAGWYEYRSGDRALFFARPGETAVRFAESVGGAEAAVSSNAVSLRVRVEMRMGRMATTQELATAVRWRN